MKKLIGIILALVLMPVLALASTTFEGTVVSGEVVSVTAPFGGTVSHFSLRAGSRIDRGSVVATTPRRMAPLPGYLPRWATAWKMS